MMICNYLVGCEQEIVVGEEELMYLFLFVVFVG